ncbi:MAG: hypothetical protein ACK5NY_08250 [Burkholderiaceae bacterium]
MFGTSNNLSRLTSARSVNQGGLSQQSPHSDLKSRLSTLFSKAKKLFFAEKTPVLDSKLMKKVEELKDILAKRNESKAKFDKAPGNTATNKQKKELQDTYSGLCEKYQSTKDEIRQALTSETPNEQEQKLQKEIDRLKNEIKESNDKTLPLLQTERSLENKNKPSEFVKLPKEKQSEVRGKLAETKAEYNELKTKIKNTEEEITGLETKLEKESQKRLTIFLREHKVTTRKWWS